MKRITVFCGASAGNSPEYIEQAKELGETLAKNNIELVYGGARIGLMGAVADAVLANGGRVSGVLPDFLKSKEIAHSSLTELIIVKSMHERKTKMNDISDGVIALPGGFGTMDELFEMLTWAQLGLHQKPIGLLNTNGYYDGLVELIQSMTNKGFVSTMNQSMLTVSESIDELLSKMKNYKPPHVSKWIKEEDI